MIRVGEGTHAELLSLKGDDESFDDVINRLLELRRNSIREGAGYWSEEAAAIARKQRQGMKGEVGDEWSS